LKAALEGPRDAAFAARRQKEENGAKSEFEFDGCEEAGKGVDEKEEDQNATKMTPKPNG